MGSRAGKWLAAGVCAVLLAAIPAAGESGDGRSSAKIAAAKPVVIPARAVSVLNGRTIRVRALAGKRRFYTVRLVGIDAGKVAGSSCPDGKARARLNALLFKRGKGVRLRLKLDSSKRRFDSDGRLRAYAYRSSGSALQIVLLREGEAKLQDSPSLRLRRSLKRAEQRAKSAGRGVWKPCSSPLTSGTGVPTNPSPPPAPDDRPNILFIVTDDQAPPPDSMRVMPKTLSLFAGQGTTFGQAVGTTPLCCPARASIFSGRYAHNHGVLQNEGRGELDLRYTIQRYLRDAGYMTGIVGKFLNYWEATLREQPPHFDDPPDFDRWTISSGLYSPILVNDQGTLKNIQQYSTAYFKDKALEFLGEASGHGSPWFLHLAVTAPHTVHDRDKPPVPEAKYENAPVPEFSPPGSYFEPDLSDKPPWVIARRTPEQVQAQRTGALRTLMSVDDMVDEIFTELDRIGEADNTLAFFLSDNGYQFGEHSQIGKGSPYLEAIRVPMYMRWPAGSPAARVDNRFVANIDLLPTVLDATGVSAPPEVTLDGRSLLDATWDRNRILLEFWGALGAPDPNHPAKTFASTLTRDYHYTEWFEEDDVTPRQWPPNNPLGTGPISEFYDLFGDPWELTNLLHDGNSMNDPAVESISAQLARDRSCAGHGPEIAEPPPCP